MAQIEVRNARKYFRVLRKKPGIIGYLTAFYRNDWKVIPAVDTIDFTIEPGEIVGYIGANGAGKSTTVKLLAGILEPTSGEVLILGRNPCRQRIANARDIGVVFGQKTQLWWDLPVIESYNLLQKIYEIPRDMYKQNLDEMITVLDLESFLHQPVRLLSLGQRMRCDLAAPFLHNPKIIYLDEPTIGLDVSVKATIRTFLRRFCRQRSITLFLTTHDLRDIEEITDRVILIDQGHKLYDGPLPGLKRLFGDRRQLCLELGEPLDPVIWQNEFTDCQLDITVDGLGATVSFDPEKVTPTRIIEFALKQHRVLDFTLADASIEDIVKRVYHSHVIE